MFYFIPSWYADENSYESKNQIAYQQSNHIEFDDTINQVRMFSQNGEKVKIIIPVYFPNQRHFLHRQGLFETSYLNIFDKLQEIPGDLDMQRLDYHDFNLADDLEYIYTPFALLLYRGDQKYGRIDFGSEGNMLFLTIFANEKLSKKLTFDDRGFLSRVDYFDEQENFIKSEYLNFDGDIEFVHNSDDSIDMVENHTTEYRHYDSMQALIVETTATYFDTVLHDQDAIIVAADNNHNKMLTKNLPKKQLILSYFADRIDLEHNDIHSDAELVLVDSDQNKKLLAKENKKVLQVPPFDTRLRLGQSNQEKKLKLFFFIDKLSDQDLELTIVQLVKVMEKMPAVELTIATYNSGQHHDQLEEFFNKINENTHNHYEYQFDVKDTDVAENAAIDEDETVKKRKARKVKYFVAGSEVDIISVLNSMRLIIDLSDEPDVFLQIAGISAGIPQIMRTHSMYVEDGKNGKRINNIGSDLVPAIEFYLVGLRNWNQALVYATNKISDYTNGEIVDKIKTALKGNLDG